MTERELGWLAGLLEGEGTFGVWYDSKHKPRLERGNHYPRIRLKMVDEDVVARAARLINRSYWLAVKQTTDRQAQYETEIKGAPAVALLHLLLPELSKRRRARIKEIVA